MIAIPAEAESPKFRMPSLVPAASSRAKLKSTPTLMNIFRRVFNFIKCFSFTEVLQEILRDITQNVWIFLFANTTGHELTNNFFREE